MKAKFTKTQVQNGRNYADKKETLDTYKVIAYYKGEFHEPITCRTYIGRSSSASVVYASIWVHGWKSPRGKGIDVAGHGDAGGYGYHKGSAAIQAAIDSAGIELYGSAYGRPGEENKRARIDGVGDTAIESALLAIGRALGYTKLYLVKG